jgi:hypothetical protein
MISSIKASFETHFRLTSNALHEKLMERKDIIMLGLRACAVIVSDIRKGQSHH